MTADKPKKLMSFDDAYQEFFAHLITKTTLRNWINRGIFTRVKIGNKLFMDRETLLKEIDSHKEKLGK